LCSRGVTEF